LRRRVEIFLDGPPTHPEAPFDLPNRQTLAPVEVMQVIYLTGGEHHALIRHPPERPAVQDLVLCKIRTAAVFVAEVLSKSRLAPELSCCLQDRALSGLERAAVGDSARQRPDLDHHATTSPGSMVVTSADSRGTRPGTRGLQHLPAAALASWAAAQRLPGRYFDGWKIRSLVLPVNQ
jgi:hypothetical protein